MKDAHPTWDQGVRDPLPSSSFCARLALARDGARLVPCPNGSYLHVYELQSPADGIVSLMFERAESFWRLRPFPPGWHALSDADLLALRRAGVDDPRQ